MKEGSGWINGTMTTLGGISMIAWIIVLLYAFFTNSWFFATPVTCSNVITVTSPSPVA